MAPGAPIIAVVPIVIGAPPGAAMLLRCEKLGALRYKNLLHELRLGLAEHDVARPPERREQCFAR